MCVVEDRARNGQLQRLQVDLRFPQVAENFMWYCVVLFLTRYLNVFCCPFTFVLYIFLLVLQFFLD